MGADEEYLDNLLKSVTASLEEEERANKMDEMLPEEETLAEENSAEDFIEDLFTENLFAEEEVPEKEVPAEDVTEEEFSDAEVADGDTSLDIDAMLKEMNLLENEADVPDLEQVSEETDPFAEPFYSAEIDEDLEEINNLLEKADNNEVINEDMLTMFPEENDVQPEREEPFDLMSEINNQEAISGKGSKKEAKERKRKEKQEAKTAKKIAKEEAKAQKKTGSVPVAEEDELVPTVESQTEDASAFDNFQEVEEFEDIEALLGSLDMGNLEFSTASVGIANSADFSEENSLSLDNPNFDDENGEIQKETKKSTKKDKKEGGIFKRFVDFLMEEDEDEEKDKKKKNAKAVDGSREEESDTNESGRKDKKVTKGRNAKNGKNKKSQDGDEEETDNKKGKKKEKKPKKEKKQKSEIEDKFKPIDGGNSKQKVGKGGVMAVIILAASVFAVVMLSNIIFSPMLAKQRAEKAFNEQDYETCYQELSGWDLSESEEKMRDFALVVLKMERRLEVYEQSKGLRQKLEALDSLMKAVQNYDELYQEALNCGAEGEVEARYNTIIGLLGEKYGLSEKEAKAIAALDSDVEYTRYLTAIIEGRSIPGLENNDTDELPGLLPEEEELPDTKFSE